MEQLKLTKQQVRNCDIKAVEKFRIPSIILMENAGIAAGALALEILSCSKIKSVSVIAGPGNNGGDGFVVARYLFNAGINVEIFVTCACKKFTGDTLTNLNICQNMNIPIVFSNYLDDDRFLDSINNCLNSSDLIIDAMLGTGLVGPPREPIASIIPVVNNTSATVLSLDIPSGLDCDTGVPFGDIAVIADWTITFAAWKIGFDNPDSKKYTGKVRVAGIGIKTELLI